MRRIDVDRLAGLGVNPAMGHAAARRQQDMLARAVDDRQFENTIERRD